MFRLLRQRRKKKKRTARDDGINTGDAHLYSSADDYYARRKTADDYYESKAAQVDNEMVGSNSSSNDNGSDSGGCD